MTFFWIVAFCLTGAACAALMWPFLRSAKNVANGNDLEVYRDQLAEVDRDVDRGSITRDAAEEARAEIGRRILHAADSDVTTPGRARPARTIASAAVLAVPVLAIGIYWSIGSPHMPGQPLAGRLASDPAESSLDELVVRAERHLMDNPADGRGWDVLAPIYLRIGRIDDAVVAFRNAIRLNGASAEREAGLGDALFRAAGNTVTNDAQAAFGRALAIDGSHEKARFFVALALMQQGDADGAALRWRAMIGDLPQHSPWRGAAAQALARIVQPEPEADLPQPGAADIEAAEQLSEDDRTAMIEGMVERLDRRLRDNPDNAAGWQRLIRSYTVLGREADAREALTRGLAGLGSQTSDGMALRTFAASLGIETADSQ